MDNLSVNAMLAKQAGMSYGQWMAVRPFAPVCKKETPKDWKPCKFCGKAFKPKKGKQYCDIECRRKAYAEKQSAIMREYMCKYRERKKAKNAE